MVLKMCEIRTDETKDLSGRVHCNTCTYTTHDFLLPSSRDPPTSIPLSCTILVSASAYFFTPKMTGREVWYRMRALSRRFVCDEVR